MKGYLMFLLSLLFSLLVSTAQAANISVTGCNSFSGGADAAGNVTLTCVNSGTTLPPPPPITPPSTELACPGFSATHLIKLPWGALGTGNVSVYTKDHGGFRNNEAVVIAITTPNKAQTGNTSIGHIAGLQYQDQPVSARTSKMSAVPCDFANAFTGADTVGAAFTVGQTVVRNGVTYPYLQPNTTYYFNINNRDKNGNDTCAVGQSCNMIIQLYKPAGL